MSQNRLLLKQIIKSILLTEAPIDIWKNKNLNLSQEQISQAEKYFNDLTSKYKALIHPTASDLTKLTFEQLETLYKTIEIAKNKNLKANYVQWLTKQFKQLNLNLNQIIEDYIPPLLSLQKNKDKFEPNFLENLESIEQLNQELNQKVSSDELAVSEEQFGKLAEENGWVLYMPHTTEASCEIGKTGGRRDTTWCTTRPDASNMFLHYNAQPNESTILFYVIKKGVNAEKDPFAKMSVGFIDGKPMFDQGSGGVSVNASNDNLTREKFEKVLGKDLANKFLQIMQEKSNSLKGEHPAKEEFRKLVQNPRAFSAKLDSFSDDENGIELRKNFIDSASQYPEVSPEVLTLLAKDKNASVYVRYRVAKNPKAPIEALTLLAKDKDKDVRYYVAQNPNTPVEVFTLLAKDTDEEVRKFVAENPNTPVEVLTLLAKDINKDVRKFVAKNPKAPIEVLTLLAKDINKDVRKFVAGNPKAPIEVFTLLAKDTNDDVRQYVAGNPKAPIEILTLLAKEPNLYVRQYVALNPNTPPKVLTLLAKDTDGYVRKFVAKNPNTPVEVLTLLAKDTSQEVRRVATERLNQQITENVVFEKVFTKLLRLKNNHN